MAVNMKIRKKGFFFSFTAILLITVFLASLDVQDYVTLVNKVPTIEGRVRVSNDFVHDLNDNYIERFISTAGLSSMNYYTHHKIYDDLSFDSEGVMRNRYRSLFMNGTYDGSKVLGTSFMDLINNITLLANDSLGLDVRFSIGEFSLFQSEETGPWYLGTKVEVNYTLNATVAVWYVSRNITGRFSIIGLEDPFIAINTQNNGDIEKRIIKSPSHDSWEEYSYFEDTVLNGEYFYGNNSPSFLSRIINLNDPSECCGISSFINKSNGFKGEGNDLGEYKNISFVDVCYFKESMSSNIDCDAVWQIDPLSTDFDSSNHDYPFRIDTYHLAIFNLTETRDKTQRKKD